MRRRALALGAAAMFSAQAADAQLSSRRARIGLLVPGTSASFAGRSMALRDRVRALGYVEPDTLQVTSLFADGQPDRLPGLARELAAMPLDVIVTASTPAIRAAMAATSTMPIVMAASANAVREGLIASLARPGGNVTGVTYLLPELALKQVELLRELRPSLARVGVLWGTGGSGPIAVDGIRSIAVVPPLDVHSYEIVSREEITAAFRAIATVRCEGVVVVDGPLVQAHADWVAALAIEHALPTVSSLRDFVDAGALASYGPSVLAMYRRAAITIDRVIRGARPAELPVEQPTVFELVINLKTARSLGLAIPPALLVRADEVIE